MRRFAKVDKVADLLKHAISNALLTHLEDPRLKWVTVTGVRLSRDLAVARVFYTVIESGSAPEEAAAALNDALRPLRRYLAANLRLRQLPDIRFTFDEAEGRARRIDEILEGLKSETK